MTARAQLQEQTHPFYSAHAGYSLSLSPSLSTTTHTQSHTHTHTRLRRCILCHSSYNSIVFSCVAADTERPVSLRSPRSTRGLPPRPSAAAAVAQPHAASAATANPRHSSSAAPANPGHATSAAAANPGRAGSRVLCLNSPSPPGSTSTNCKPYSPQMINWTWIT